MNFIESSLTVNLVCLILSLSYFIDYSLLHIISFSVSIVIIAGFIYYYSFFMYLTLKNNLVREEFPLIKF